MKIWSVHLEEITMKCVSASSFHSLLLFDQCFCFVLVVALLLLQVRFPTLSALYNVDKTKMLDALAQFPGHDIDGLSTLQVELLTVRLLNVKKMVLYLTLLTLRLNKVIVMVSVKVVLRLRKLLNSLLIFNSI